MSTYIDGMKGEPITPQPTNKDNFLIEITPEFYDLIMQERGDEFIENREVHYSPNWEDKVNE